MTQHNMIGSDGTILVPTMTTTKYNVAGKLRIAALLEAADSAAFIGQVVTVCGWSRTIRKQGGGAFCFVSLSDGSTALNLQIVVDSSIPGFQELQKCSVGCSFMFTGQVCESPAAGQALEVSLKDSTKHSFKIYGTTDSAAYPLAKKNHSREYLREIGHLRPRTNLIGCVTRVRSQMCMAVHHLFQCRGMRYIHTPLITAADCEGGGELFQVTTLLKSEAISKMTGGSVDYKHDFFARPTYLTCSGQLDVENYCCAMGDVYTFGPTFRAEKSHTSRHLAEFWMVEPEFAFADIQDLMDIAEENVQFCVSWALKNCREDLIWLTKSVDADLIGRLETIASQKFERITYTDAVRIIQESKKFNVEWGDDLATEHERYLTETVYAGTPVFVYNYPATLKAFYMRANEDGKTVAAMDCLLPTIGELIGGSQREERLDVLDKKIKEKGLPLDEYWWYRDLRHYGSIPHSGYGLGFDRLIMLVTGVENIRDVIPFPRYPGHAEF